jgi:hypothetical protein
MYAGGRPITVTWLTITDVGRQASPARNRRGRSSPRATSTRHQLDPTDTSAVAEAEKRFKKLTGAGNSQPSKKSSSKSAAPPQLGLLWEKVEPTPTEVYQARHHLEEPDLFSERIVVHPSRFRAATWISRS